jgi:hypothetical protein
VVDQLGDIFHTTHKVNTTQVVKIRGRYCGDITLVVYLANVVGPVPLVVDLRITHDRFRSRSDPSLNGHLHYPNDIDKSLNEVAVDKIRKYRSDYPPTTVTFMTAIASTSGRLHSEFVRFLFLHVHWETDRFFVGSGVQVAQTDRDQFHLRHVTFSSQFKNRVGLTLDKSSSLRVNLNIDGVTITSKSHTHYPPDGVRCSVNTSANWLGSRIKESSYFLYSK